MPVHVSVPVQVHVQVICDVQCGHTLLRELYRRGVKHSLVEHFFDSPAAES
jgi:hypothetical protein